MPWGPTSTESSDGLQIRPPLNSGKRDASSIRWPRFGASPLCVTPECGALRDHAFAGALCQQVSSIKSPV
jgi:hypothetical protein